MDKFLIRKRKFPRVRTKVPARAKPTTRTLFDGEIVSISEGGVFIATNQTLPIGSHLLVTMNLDLKRKTISCFLQGTIVWKNSNPDRGPVGYGIAFDQCPAGAAKSIRDYVKETLGPDADLEDSSDESEKRKPPGTRGQLRG